MQDLKQAQETFQMMECGNIQLNFPIQYGILLVGNTKAGKTTTSHYLCNQVLEGDKNNVNSTVYKLRSGKKEYSTAKIGDQQSVSETQIPNFFLNELDGKKIYLVDCPGYLDSFGCYRIISNRFFHYQVFSKVQKAKFIITFTYNDMLKTADKMLKTFRQFLKGFQNIEQIKQSLIQSISIMVTSVPRDKKLSDIASLFSQNHNVESSLQSIFRELKNSVIKKQRIYLFEAAELGKVCNTSNDLLKKINNNCQFWQRNVNNQKQVDMKNIKISISDYAGEDMPRFDRQLKLVQSFFQERFKKQLQSLVRVIKKFQEDCIASEDSSKFVQQMILISQQKKLWRKEKSNCKQLYQGYQEKRNNLKNLLFKSIQNTGESQKTFITNDSPFWLCKYKTLRQISNYNKQISVFVSDERSVKNLDTIQSMVKCILQMLYNLGKKKKEKIVAKDNEKNQAVLDFVYEIYKNIVISNKLFKLVISSPDKPEDQENRNQATINFQKGMNFILVEYPKTVKSLFLKGMKNPFFNVFQKGLEGFKFQENLTQKGAAEAANFLKILKEQFEKNLQIDQTVTKAFLNNLDNKIITLFNFEFESIKKEATPSLKILKRMEQLREQTMIKIQKCNENKFDNQKLKVQNNRIISLMAQCLYKNGYNKLAIELYDALFDGHKIMNLLENQQEKMKKNQAKDIDYLNFLIYYMKLAKKYHRIQIAMTKGQHALHIARDKSEIEKINEVSSFLKKLCQAGRLQNEKDSYEEHLFEEIVASSLKKETCQQIQSIISRVQKQQK